MPMRYAPNHQMAFIIIRLKTLRKESQKNTYYLVIVYLVVYCKRQAICADQEKSKYNKNKIQSNRYFVPEN